MTTPHQAGCLICGRDLVYMDSPEEVTCSLCGERTLADVRCAAGTGIFIALITGSTPLATEAWRLSNEMTARALSVIARHGGPRCCKRDSWLAIRDAAGFCREKLGITLPFNEEHVCPFSAIKRECRRQACLFYGGEE
ncbi:MAG TPA: hypothetical protein ENN85_00600 [Methanoculleus sp.]|nr:hypothetical protein [Methanoculleus sp.]